MFKIFGVPWKLGSLYTRYLKGMNSYSGRGEEAAVVKVWQEELKDEKHGSTARCVCVQVSLPGEAVALPCSLSFQRVGCTGYREVKMRMVSPKFFSLSLPKLGSQPHLERKTTAPKFLPSILCHGTKTIT